MKLGVKGQKININDNVFEIGEVVRLTDNKISCFYEIIWNEHTFQVDLFNLNNSVVGLAETSSYKWWSEAYLNLYEIVRNWDDVISIEKTQIQKIKLTRKSSKPL